MPNCIRCHSPIRLREDCKPNEWPDQYAPANPGKEGEMMHIGGCCNLATHRYVASRQKQEATK